MSEPAGGERRDGDPTLDEFERDLRGGLPFANLQASINQDEIRTGSPGPDALAETSASKGVARVTEVAERKELTICGFAGPREAGRQAQPFTGADECRAAGRGVDRSTRRPLCHSTCCMFRFPASVQEPDESVARWDYLQPYRIARRRDGYSVHLDSGALESIIQGLRPMARHSGNRGETQRVWDSPDTRTPNRDLAPPKLVTDGERDLDSRSGAVARRVPRSPAGHPAARSAGDPGPRGEPVCDNDLDGEPAGGAAAVKVLGQQRNHDCRLLLQPGCCRRLGGRGLPWRPDVACVRDPQQGEAQAEPHRVDAWGAGSDEAGLPRACAAAGRGDRMPEETSVFTPCLAGERT